MPTLTRRGHRRAQHEETIAKFAVGHTLALTLPVELLTEIISYIPSLPLDVAYFAPGSDIDQWKDKLLPPRQLRKTITLRSLSQTCRLWRQVFLPLLWETVEIASLRVEDDDTWMREINRALYKKCVGLTENEDLASYVKHIRVALVPSTLQKKVFPAFVKCLNSLPNLKALAFHFLHPRVTAAVKKAFHGHVYPSIRTLALQDEAARLFPHFPNVTKVVAIGGGHGYDNGGHDILSIAATMDTVFSNIDTIDGFKLYAPVDHERILRCMPNLRFVGFSSNGSQVQTMEATYRFLAKLEKLQTIRLFAWSHDPYSKDNSVERATNLAEGMFKLHSNIPDRRILVYSFSGKWTKVIHVS